MIWSYGTYELDDDPDRVDVDAVWAFLSTEAYWGRSRSRLDFEAQLATAWRVVGAYETATGRLVGFARAISDGVAYGYLSDVFVLPDARGAASARNWWRRRSTAAPAPASAGACTPPTPTASTANSASRPPTPDT